MKFLSRAEVLISAHTTAARLSARPVEPSDCCTLETQALCQSVIPLGSCGEGITHADAFTLECESLLGSPMRYSPANPHR